MSLLKQRYDYEAEELKTSAPKPTFTPDLNGLIKWLEDQPGETAYNYCDAYDCLWARYPGGGVVPHYGGLPPKIVEVVQGKIPQTWTYSAALQRAYKLRGKL